MKKERMFGAVPPELLILAFVLIGGIALSWTSCELMDGDGRIPDILVEWKRSFGTSDTS